MPGHGGAGAFYTVMQKSLLTKISPMRLVTYMMLAGNIILLPYAVNLVHQIQEISTSTLIILLYSGIFPGAIAYILWSYVLTKMSVNWTMSYFYFFPLITLIMAYIFLGESANMLFMVGSFIALIGAITYNKQLD